VKLDRNMQRKVLEALRESYPLSVEAASLPASGREWFQANLHYLKEVGLIEAATDVGKGADIIMVRVTARGLDFLQGDGGVEAIIRGGATSRSAGRKKRGEGRNV
jgi:hypothetical protein